ncbi:nuclear transport factor 2 family protein [Novosphingobium sp.]|uniref:nuclear transport factor 2 family protein n=1 Tax=Novosphingobium sp. TaxID=1874826 RepID=UPI0026034866|nr:nuclear transport factor 2 family protein [Novosphingobium sp.]
MSEELAAEVARLRAIQQIEQLPICYANCMDIKDVDSLLPLFSDQILMGPAGKGREGVRAFYTQAWSGFRRSVHRISNHAIALTGDDTATGHVYCMGEQESAEGRWQTLMMSYDDRYVLEDGLWRFARRKLSFWYRDVEGVRHIGSDYAQVPTLPDSRPEWRAFMAERI